MIAIAGAYVLGGIALLLYGMVSRSDDKPTRGLETLATLVAAVAWPLAIVIWLTNKFRGR